MRIFMLMLAVVASGCATSHVVSVGPDTYLLMRQGGTGAVGTNVLKIEAIRDASAHCTKLGKQFRIISTEQSEARGPGIYPSADIQFMCLKDGDASLTRPVLEPVANTKIEIKK